MNMLYGSRTRLKTTFVKALGTLLDGDTRTDVEVLAECLMVTTTDVEQN